MRHAKSNWHTSAPTDFERPLNKRGKKDVELMSDKAKKINLKFDLVLCSPAKRARKTCKKFLENINFKGDINFVQRIYEAKTLDLLNLINKIENQNKSVLLIGHNPGFTNLANYLAGTEIANLPTCSIVKINFELNDWSMISSGLGDLEFFLYPKMLHNSSKLNGDKNL